MKKIVILYNKMNVTSPYATNELLTSSIYDSNGTNLAFPQSVKGFCYTLVPIYINNMLFILKSELKNKRWDKM